jgi:hypothetical protein
MTVAHIYEYDSSKTNLSIKVGDLERFHFHVLPRANEVIYLRDDMRYLVLEVIHTGINDYQEGVTPPDASVVLLICRKVGSSPHYVSIGF